MEIMMAKTKAKPMSPFQGRWRIVSMTEWDDETINDEVEAYLEFDARGTGEFQFGYVRGGMDCRITTRDGDPAVEWSWEGSDEMDEAMGRGWAVLKGDELKGMIFIHLGDSSEFVATRLRLPKTPKTK
jgi:hypothetical protein